MKRFQSPCLHHVRINGRDTSITVEPEFWEQFRLMTMERQTTIGKLLAEIDRTGRLLPHQEPGCHRVRTLSAAVRVFVLQTLISRSSSGAQRARLRSPRSP
jgi:predicted DNA-binding ribbon-helix-helix protein